MVKPYNMQKFRALIFFSVAVILKFAFPPFLMAQSQYDLIFVQIETDNIPPQLESEYSSVMDRYTGNPRIVSLPANSTTPVILTSDFYAACDPAVSFDSKQIIFSAKKEKQDSWQLWKMNRDGSGKVCITSSVNDCLMPVYAGNRFYLDDPQPTPQIIYTGRIDAKNTDPELRPRYALFGIDTSGQKIHRLTFNPYSDISPDILSNGRIVFSSWQPLDGGRFALLAVNIDGTDLMPYYGNHEPPRYKEMAHVSGSTGYVYYIETDASYRLGGGDIAAVLQKRPLHSYRKVASAADGIYHSPCSLPNGDLIASFRPKINGEFSLYQIDPVKGNRKGLIYREAGWHSFDVQVLLPHPKVKGRSNWLIPGSDTGVFYCLNVYMSHLPDAEKIKPGEVKFVRVTEGLIPETDTDMRLNSAQDGAHSAAGYMPRRILGTVPVETDGSFQIKVPAETPVSFQLLNEDYVKIREQKGWTWVMGNENRGCIGCHEDRELSPPNILPDAVKKPPVDMAISGEKRRLIDFRNQVWPIINERCATSNCHHSGNVQPVFEAANDPRMNDGILGVYSDLLNSVDYAKERSYVVPGSALKSPLITVLFSEMPLSVNAHKSGAAEITHKNLLTKEEKQTILEWIDLGAFWDLSGYLQKEP